jgi:hypothetical protein
VGSGERSGNEILRRQFLLYFADRTSVTAVTVRLKTAYLFDISIEVMRAL